MSILNHISRLLPARLRPVPVLETGERTKLFASVNDHDPCLRAVTDRLAETLEGEFLIAIDPTRSDTDKLRACEGMRVAYYNLRFIEDERDAAKAWRKALEEQIQTQG